MQYALITDGAVAFYPYTIEQFRTDNPCVSLPQTPTDEQLAEVGIFPVSIEPLPDLAPGEKLAGYEIAKVGQVWTQQWEIAALPLDERKAALREAVKAKQAEIRMAGWAHDFGAAGTHTLDLRDAEDKVNWTLLLTKASGMIAAGAGAAPVKIRTAANETITVTANEARDAMLAFLAWGEVLLSAKWALDTAITAADQAGIGNIDINVGWPV